jgi:hypothetical protein
MITRLKWAVAALAVLAGCGDLGRQGILLPLASRAIPAVGEATGGGGDRFAVAARRPGFTPQDIAANTGAFMFIGIPTMGPPVPARLIADNNGHQTYDVQVGFTVSFRDGLLVATRSLGEDLMGADVAQVHAALLAGGGTAIRRHDVLDGMDQVVTSTFSCVIAPQGTEETDLGLRQVMARKFSETCEGSGVRFENLYWLDGDGTILSSRQYISRTVAYLRGNRL